MAKAVKKSDSPDNTEVKDLVVFQNMDLEAKTEKIKSIFEETLQGEDLEISDLEMIKLPSQGLEYFTREGQDGKAQMVEEIIGILLYQKRTRAYWDSPFTGGNQPPTCYSEDCITGVGTPGGDCSQCPFNEFGSANNPANPESRAKACAEKRLLFMLEPDSLLPVIVRAGTASIKSTKTYLLNLMSKSGRHTFEVVTRLYLKKRQSTTGQDYSELNCVNLGPLDDQTIAQVKTFRDQMMPLMNRAAATIAQASQADANDTEPADGAQVAEAQAPPIDEDAVSNYAQ